MRHDVPEIDRFIGDAIAGTLAIEAVDAYCGKHNVRFGDACNAIALAVARRFDDASMTYEDADAAMNTVFSLMTRDAGRQRDGFELAEPAFTIYEAFDAGEYRRCEGEDPVERYTRPLVRKVLSDA